MDQSITQALQRLSTTLRLDVEYALGMAVITYPKVILNGRLFVSKAASRSEKRNSCTVTFTDPEQPHKLSFGCIEKFISIQNDRNPEKAVHVAIMSALEVSPCTILQQMVFPSEIQSSKCLLVSDYLTSSRTGSLIAVPISNITMMCFDVSTSACSILSILLKNVDSK